MYLGLVARSRGSLRLRAHAFLRIFTWQVKVSAFSESASTALFSAFASSRLCCSSYLLVPSSRYAGPGARQARGELTGCLLYDPPAGTRWAASQ